MAIFRVPARIDFPQAGGPGFNIWHVRTNDPQGAELEGALGALEDFYSAIAGLYPASASITLGEGIIKDPLGSPEFMPDDFRKVVGAGAFTLSPSLLSIVVGWRTVSATRSGRGRTFLGPFAVGPQDQADGTPNGGTLNTIRAAAQELVSDSTAPTGWAVGVLSTKQGVLRDITGSSVRDRWAVLRSRRD